MNSVHKVEQNHIANELTTIKNEGDVSIKREPAECLVCVARSNDYYDVYLTNTIAAGVSLYSFLCKYTHVDLLNAKNGSKFVCKCCFELINVLEHAEIEYNKLKETFEEILRKNPLFETVTEPVKLSDVKTEFPTQVNEDVDPEDSDEEPLVKKKRRQHKVEVRKKKTSGASNKRKLRSKNNEESWDCEECGLHEESGGAIAEATHKLSHSFNPANTILRNVKTEDSAEGSQSPPTYNGFSLEDFDNFDDDDDDSSSLPDTFSNGRTSKKRVVSRKTKLISAPKIKKKPKTVHQCDQCPAKYTSLTRLEQHKQKHDGSKPPYICEVCGAHYKHKRACDIHIKLHKGISDWKCEECNKLFPSKNALQRHNNIHTGKLNYQCDLCGKSFIHTSSFKMHKLSHSGVKPHACDVCGLALMTRSHLKRHKRVHSGEKRHECGVCGKRFSERYNLIAHSKSHEAHEALALPPQPKRRLFRCSFCTERFERRYMLERHVSGAHGRTLERPPPTPRNTMSKLLKAQAQQRPHPPPPPLARPPLADTPTETDTKDERSPEPRDGPLVPQKLLAQLSSSSIITSTSWSGAYAAEFGLRHDYSH